MVVILNGLSHATEWRGNWVVIDACDEVRIKYGKNFWAGGQLARGAWWYLKENIKSMAGGDEWSNPYHYLKYQKSLVWNNIVNVFKGSMLFSEAMYLGGQGSLFFVLQCQNSLMIKISTSW
jgi:hypothetical protein